MPAENLVNSLRTTLASVDPVPARVTAAALSSLGYRRPEARLAELVADSALSPAAVRGGPYAPRLLTFTTPGLVIELEVDASAALRAIVGHLAPSRPAPVEIRWPGGAHTTRADLSGHFTATDVPSGPISMVCHLPDQPIATTWTNV